MAFASAVSDTTVQGVGQGGVAPFLTGRQRGSSTADVQRFLPMMSTPVTGSPRYVDQSRTASGLPLSTVSSETPV